MYHFTAHDEDTCFHAKFLSLHAK